MRKSALQTQASAIGTENEVVLVMEYAVEIMNLILNYYYLLIYYNQNYKNKK